MRIVAYCGLKIYLFLASHSWYLKYINKLLFEPKLLLKCFYRELLSVQQHYDWGLRALKTVLKGSGNLLQKEKQALMEKGEKGKRDRRGLFRTKSNI